MCAGNQCLLIHHELRQQLCGFSTLLHLLQNREEAAGHLSRLIFVSLACGIGMFLLTWFGATPVMTGMEHSGLCRTPFGSCIVYSSKHKQEYMRLLFMCCGYMCRTLILEVHKQWRLNVRGIQFFCSFRPHCGILRMN